MATGTDYDVRRVSAPAKDGLEELRARHASKDHANIDGEEADYMEGFELHGSDLLDEELVVTVIPMQANEFRCDRCFLVRHNSQRDQPARGLCVDCT